MFYIYYYDLYLDIDYCKLSNWIEVYDQHRWLVHGYYSRMLAGRFCPEVI